MLVVWLYRSHLCVYWWQVGVSHMYVWYMTRKTFFADDRADNPHISARPSVYVRADNQQIPRRHLEDSAWTISRFRAEQLADSMRNSADVRQRLPKVKTYCLHKLVLMLLTIFLLCFFHLSVLSYLYSETCLRQPPVGQLQLAFIERWLLYRGRFQCFSAISGQGGWLF